MHICQETETGSNSLDQNNQTRAVKPTEALKQQAIPEGQVTMGTLKLPCMISGAPLQ